MIHFLLSWSSNSISLMGICGHCVLCYKKEPKSFKINTNNCMMSVVGSMHMKMLWICVPSWLRLLPLSTVISTEKEPVYVPLMSILTGQETLLQCWVMTMKCLKNSWDSTLPFTGKYIFFGQLLISFYSECIGTSRWTALYRRCNLWHHMFTKEPPSLDFL